MSTASDISKTVEAPVSCEQVLNVLVLNWPEEPSDAVSPALLSHLAGCRSCMSKWIAIEAAADLAGCDVLPSKPNQIRRIHCG